MKLLSQTAEIRPKFNGVKCKCLNCYCELEIESTDKPNKMWPWYEMDGEKTMVTWKALFTCPMCGNNEVTAHSETEETNVFDKNE